MERWKGKIQVDNQTVIKVGGRNAKEMKNRLDKELRELNGSKRR